MAKSRLNLSIDEDLIDFAKDFAAKNRMAVADMVTQYFLSLKRQDERELQQSLLANPAFQAAMEETKEKLKQGTAKWFSFEEVFGDDVG